MAERCPLSHGDGPCEVLSQSCCESREKPPETVSRHSEAPPEATGPCCGCPSCEGPSCEGQDCRTVQCLRASSLPVTRSHLDSVSVLKLQPAVDSCTVAPDSCTVAPGSCTPAPGSCTPACAELCTLVDSSARGPVLVCKRSMQLQQCNMVTTVCRGALGPDGPIPQMCAGPPGAQGPQTAATEEPSCDRTLCYGPHLHHTNFEDTFAAYCHPQPIPAPSQLLPPLMGPEGPSHLSVPRLMSSVSETGLDNKHVSCCCQLGCSWVSVLPPCPVRAPTRDVGTLTVGGALKDVGVQTDDSGTHVFPQVCLSEEPHRGPKDSGQKAGSKSPVKEVKWDAEGMTWEVYGASVDPEELGLAIQKHLELQIRETASRAAKLSRQNTNTSRHSGGSGQRKRRVLGSLRPPVCCARTTTAVD